MNPIDIIAPISLLAGSHSDTGETGQGCFMNVVAYLNGDAQITDNSPCVCVTVRPLAVVLNDLSTAKKRQRLLPFVMRAMGSATKDQTILSSRIARLRQYGAECEDAVNSWRAELRAADPAAAARAYSYAYAYSYADANAEANAEAYAYAEAEAEAEVDPRAYAYTPAAHRASAAANAYAHAYDDAYTTAYTYTKAYTNANSPVYADACSKRDELMGALFDAGLRCLDDVLPALDAPGNEVIERAARLCELAQKETT